MGWCRPEGCYRLAMGFCGISFVDFPSIARMPGGKMTHVFVAMGFGKDRGSSDVCKATVAFYECCPGDAAIVGESVAVDNNRFRPQPETVERPMHGKDRGPEDVDAVNFFVIHDSDSPCQSFVFDYDAQGFATFFTDLLRVVEPWMAECRGEDYGGGIDGPGKSTAPGFVATGFNDCWVEA